jgi:tRNA (guanine10-N2)-methyltransferase
LIAGVNNLNYKYELAKRAYLGPTSADNDIAFLMANQAGAVENSFVLDPFVGTGGLLIPPSHFK